VRIHKTRVVLRDEKRSGDAHDLFRWLNLEEWQYYDEPDKPFQGVTPEAFDRRKEERRRRQPPSNSHTWQVNTAEGRHIGWVNYYHLDERLGRAYVGICLPEEETWGKGYGTEALTLLMDHLLRQMALQEVRAATWTGNSRMMRCAEKCGFKESGRMAHRAEHSVRGEPLERVEFAISRAEWLVQRASQ